MSKKQNKKLGENRRKPNVEALERQLLKTSFPLECESIPLESLNEKEQEIVQKCINREDLNDKEFKTLKRVLQQYRPAIQKLKPSETIEQVEEAKNLIKTEQDLLDILDQPERRLLHVNLPLDGVVYEMDFEVLPLKDSRVVQSLETQIDLFKDYSEHDKLVYAKAQSGQVISKEEKAIIDKMNKEINEKAGEHYSEIVDGLLVSQLRLPNSSMNEDKRKEFWSKFPFNPKFAIYMKVQDRLGLTEQDTEALFQISK